MKDIGSACYHDRSKMKDKEWQVESYKSRVTSKKDHLKRNQFLKIMFIYDHAWSDQL